MYNIKMMPGQEPYTEEELAQVQGLIAAACEAETIIPEYQLEDVWELANRNKSMCDCKTCATKKEPQEYETWELYHLLDQALKSGRFSKAFTYADAMCVPEKAEQGRAQFPTPIRDYYDAMRLYSQEMIQSLDDRVEQYNMYATHRHIGH